MKNSRSAGETLSRDALKKAMNLYLVTDRTWSQGEDFYSQVEQALQNGVSFLQLREKELAHASFLKSACRMRTIAKKYSVPFVINDNIEVAIESGADGVHIGQGDMPVSEARERLGHDRLLGVSVQTVQQAVKAVREGADYLGAGAVFSTSTKSDARALDHRILRDICDAVDVPVVAIGGITEENTLELSGTNVSGIAVVSAILGQKDTGAAARKMAKTSRMMTQHAFPKVLTIAGSDCSGGAGIQADLKTMSAHGCYGMSVITALTAQNTTGVYGVQNASAEFVQNQMDCVFSDIRPDAVKIGMVSSKEIILAIAERLHAYRMEQDEAVPVVLDPVMVSTSGSRLLDEGAIGALKQVLMPLAALITPNLHEAELLSGVKIQTKADMLEAAEVISRGFDGSILIKGGHLDDCADDLLYGPTGALWFEGKKLDNPNTHGTGCTLSSAIASNLAIGFELPLSVKRAKKYLSGAIGDNLNLGRGRGPLNHLYMNRR